MEWNARRSSCCYCFDTLPPCSVDLTHSSILCSSPPSQAKPDVRSMQSVPQPRRDPFARPSRSPVSPVDDPVAASDSAGLSDMPVHLMRLRDFFPS